MQKASPHPDYTPAGNKYLIEVYKRGIDRAMFIADAANRYNNGHLDARFEAGHDQTRVSIRNVVAG
jgi:hypothetical protein